MVKLRSIGDGKRRYGSESAMGYNFWTLPYPALTLDDMPEFKNRLYKAVTTDQVFMEYNGRKYCKEYAKLAIRVTENTQLTRVIHDV